MSLQESDSDAYNEKHEVKRKSIWTFLRKLGPGLITGASDDDPSGIATYSQAGAQFGYGMLWTMLFSYPLMVAIQEASALIGRVTGKGVAGNIRGFYPFWVLHLIVALTVIANTINIGADIAAMGTALKLVIGGPASLYAVVFACLILILQIFFSYSRYFQILKWLTLALFAYVGTVLVVHVRWLDAIHSTFVPSMSFTGDYLTTFVAVLGTTISPYLFFWQASLEVEQIKDVAEDKSLKRAPWQAPKQIDRIRTDTVSGMAFSNIVAYFIMVSTAATLHASGITDIKTSSQAAEALRPLAGNLAFLLFSLGIIGTGLLSIPVLAGAAAFAVGESLRKPTGLNHKPRDAKVFYGVITLSTLIGLAIEWTPVEPIKALFWSAVINGIVAVPLMAVIMHMASTSKIMGKFVISRPLKILGWLATFVMTCAAVIMLVRWGK